MHTILVTGVGAPGTLGTLACLTKDGDSFRIIGVDIDENSPGRYLVDHFEAVPKPTDPHYIEALLAIVKRHDVALILPQVTKELEILSTHRKMFREYGCNILVNEPKNLKLLNNKHSLLCQFRDLCLPVPRFYLAQTRNELAESARKLDYPRRRVVAKLPVSNGMRGLRILSGHINRREMFMNDKPDSAVESLDHFIDYFDDRNMPPLLVMEYLEGQEYSVDCLADKGESHIVLPRQRHRIRSGISFDSTCVQHREIIETCRTIIQRMKLSHMFGFQFMVNDSSSPMILESNPRIQGTMAVGAYCRANVILGAVRIALGMESGTSQEMVEWGARIIRYWGGAIVTAKGSMEKF